MKNPMKKTWVTLAAALIMAAGMGCASHFQMGMNALEKKDYDKAIAEFTEEIRSNPKDAATYNNRGYAYIMTGELNLAIADFEKSLKIRPGNKDAAENLSKAKKRLENQTQAQQQPPAQTVSSGNYAPVTAVTNNAPVATAAPKPQPLTTESDVAMTAQTQAQHANLYFAGNGGKGISIAILAPTANGLAQNQSYLPALVQGEFVSNFSSYSAISVLDRERLDAINIELISPVYDDNAIAKQASLIGNLAHTTHIMGGNITKTATGYALQMHITKTDDRTAAASYSGTFTFVELDNLTGVRRASLELLQKMGVALSEKAQGELAVAATESRVNAQIALAKGVTAQMEKNEVAALSYFFQAAIFDPSLAEAVNRSSIMAANISSGNMGADARNDIAWRKAWVNRLEETERYIDNLNKTVSMPYTLFYSNEIIQGDINYHNETMSMTIKTYLYGSSSIFLWKRSVEQALQAVYDGLETTQRKEIWGLGNWPYMNVTDLDPFRVPREMWSGTWETRHNKAFIIIVELVNSRNKVIGRQEFEVKGYWEYNVANKPQAYYVYKPRAERPYISLSTQQATSVSFTGVKAADITDNLTIRFASINGEAAEIAARKGILQIRAMSKGEFDANYRFKFEFGEIRDYGENKTTFVIPNTILDDQVISIGDNAFRDKGLTNITIPNSVISIGESAFEKNVLTTVILPDGLTTIGYDAFSGNHLTNITIPNSVTYIGGGGFSGNQLASVIIPNGVTSIERYAFSGNQLTSVTIPNSVTSIAKYAFSSNQLTSVTIPNSVTSIAEYAFSSNQLTSVTIPNSVTSIGECAFRDNKLTSVKIGADVEFDNSAFEAWNIFGELYNNSGRRAGTFTVINGEWSYSPSK